MLQQGTAVASWPERLERAAGSRTTTNGNPGPRESNMAPRKRSRQEPSSATADAPTTSNRIDETHAVQLARHLAELYKRRRFTDLKVP